MRDMEVVRQRDSLRAALLASLSRDLRTPLTAVTAAAEALSATGDEAELVETVRREARRLNQFLSDLPDLTRIEEGAASPDLVPTDLTDEMPIRRRLRVALERSGHRTAEAGCAAAALGALQTAVPRLGLPDPGLPDRDGLELIGAFRDKAVPIIVLTAREASGEKVAALDLGADDDVTKPFDSDELMARIRSCLRRADQSHGHLRKLNAGPVVIDLNAHSLRRYGGDMKLSPKEFTLLAALAHHPGRS